MKIEGIKDPLDEFVHTLRCYSKVLRSSHINGIKPWKNKYSCRFGRLCAPSSGISSEEGK